MGRARKKFNKPGIDYKTLPAKVIAVMADQLKITAAIRRQKDRDGLTDLYNRRYLENALAVKINESKEKNVGPISCIMLDVDYFKSINDRYGHPGGDNVLKHFAKVLKSCTRQTDIVARIGGEEFCLILPNTSELIAVRVAQRIIEHLHQNPCPIDEGSVKLSYTVSAGVKCESKFDADPACAA